MAESFIFYESFQTAIERLPEDMQLEMYRAIVAYGINGEIYEGDNYVIASLLEAFKEKFKEKPTQGQIWNWRG